MRPSFDTGSAARGEAARLVLGALVLVVAGLNARADGV
jgi:hypothetical protein